MMIKPKTLFLFLTAVFIIFNFSFPAYADSQVTDSGKSIQISGEANNGSYKSLEFINQNTGWVISGENIYRTDDGGTNWVKLYEASSKLEKVFFLNSRTGWAIQQTSNDFRILKTIDGGKTFTVQWAKSLNNLDNQFCSFSLYFSDSKTGYALMNGVLLKTANGGKNWSQISTKIKNLIVEHMSFASGKTGWISGIVSNKNGSSILYVFKTTNGGVNWQKQFEKDSSDQSIYIIDIKFIDSSTGWFLTSDYSTLEGKLYKTINGGKKFSPVSNVRCGRPYPQMVYFLDKNNGWIPTDHGAGPIDGGILHTTNGGKTFNNIDNGGNITSAKEVIFTTKQTGYVIGYLQDGISYIIRTRDGGGTWAQILPKIQPDSDFKTTNGGST